MRRLLILPRQVLKWSLLALGALVVLFFALARTQVGRDGLRDQIEETFQRQFEGRLRIGQLKGNFINTLYARDVRLFDPAGRLVLAVDSAIIEPRWRDLLARRISVGHLTLIRPAFQLLRTEDGTWNAASVFRPDRIDSLRSPSTWAFTSTEVRLVDGSVATTSLGALPDAVRAGHVFNYADAYLDGLNARATVEWQPDVKQIDLLHLSARLIDPSFVVEDVHGQMILENGTLTLNQFVVAAEGSRLAMGGALTGLGAETPAAIDLDLVDSRLAFDPLRRLLPRLPLADAVALDARVRGPLSGLVVESVAVARGRTRLSADGTITGLPDSLDFEVSFRDNRAFRRDVRRVWPGLPAAMRLDSLRFTAYAKGVMPFRARTAFRAEAFVDAGSEAGTVRGTVGLTRPLGGPPRYHADLDAVALDLRRLDPRAPASRLNGHVALDGQGLTTDALAATLTGSLRTSLLAGRFIDSLRLDLTAAKDRFEGRVDLLQATGALAATFTLDADETRPALRLDARTTGFDLGPLLLTDSLATHLNLALRLDAARQDDAEYSGTLDLAFDSSSVTRGEQTFALPAHRTTARLTPRHHTGPRFVLAGDVADVQVTGDVPLPPLFALGTHWGTAFAEMLRAETDKPYPPVPPDTVLMATPGAEGRMADHHAAVRAAFARAGLDSTLAFSVDLALHRADILAAFVPGFPALDTDLAGTLRLAADADRLRLDGDFAGDTLYAGGLHAHGLRTTLRLGATLDAPLAETLDLTLEATTDSVRLATLAFPAPRLTFGFHARHATLALASDATPRLGPLHLDATLDLAPDRNRLTLHRLLLTAQDYTWTLDEPAPIDLFAGAMVVPGLALESNGPTPDADQRLRVHGTFSAAPADTVFVEAEAIVLRQLSDFFTLKRRIGGRLDGRLALTGGLRAPQLTGLLGVEGVALDQNILGDLTIQSRYVPGLPDVGLELRLVPVGPDASGFIHGTDVPGTLLENRLTLTGFFRLPHTTPDGTRRDEGAWDLRLDAERADLFFFSDYIFASVLANATGFVHGEGGIGGTIAHPLFTADMEIENGRFEVPQFHTAYTFEGPIGVDAEAIRINGARLTDATGGTARIEGDVRFNDYRFFSFGLNAYLDELQIMDVVASEELPFYGRLWGSGLVSLTGPIYNTLLRSTDAVTTAASELFIPVTETEVSTDAGFFIFADSTGALPDLKARRERRNLLAQRPVGERPFLDGMDLDLSISAPLGSTVHLVIDPLLGDVINAVGSGRVQVQRREGEFFTFGTFEVDSGDYLFTAGEVFVRRFFIEDGGTLTWDGDPLNARLNIPASYRTRASRAGLPPVPGSNAQSLIPLVVRLNITGRVATPVVNLSLAIDRNNQNVLGDYQGLEALLNQPERSTEYATSVLLTNSFRLTTTNIDNAAGGTLAFASVSQLVSSQLNRFLSQALPNVDFSFGVQGENAQDLDVTYGVALRLLDERLIIRGEGVYQGSGSTDNARRQESLQGEFVVEVRLSPNVSVEVFYRREGDVLIEDAALTNTTGAGLSYQTEFTTWDRFFRRLFGWLLPDAPAEEAPPPPPVADGG